MDLNLVMERPRHRLIAQRGSRPAEMARRIFELYQIPYSEEVRASVEGGIRVVTAEGEWRGTREFLLRFDAKTRPGQRLLGESEEERAASIALIDRLLPSIEGERREAFAGIGLPSPLDGVFAALAADPIPPRPNPQPALNPSKASTSFFGPALQLFGAKLLLRLKPSLFWGKSAIFSRWRDVREILSRDLDFRIAQVNAPRVDEITGPFVLGMDRSEQLVRERRQMYAAMGTVDTAAVMSNARREARRLIEDGRDSTGRIELVNGYARPVAARTAAAVFGLSGPTEAELMRVLRWQFGHIFLNLNGDVAQREKGIAASKDLRKWVLDAIAGGNCKGLLGGLLARRGIDPEALDDDGVRRVVSGLIIGAVDTTATAVAHAGYILLNDNALAEQARKDVENPARFSGWCWEALRRWPHNPILLRSAPAGTELDGKKFKQDSTVYAVTLGAMHDPDAFPAPDRLDPTRPPNRYLHFGGGLHPCAGREINYVQVPELIRQLVLSDAHSPSRPGFDGPFVDEIVVQIPGRSQ